MHAALKILLGVFLLVMASASAHAQFTRFENLTDEQGLGNMTVTAFAQDRDGFILIGTEGGLFRFNGVAVTREDDGLPPGSWIRRIIIDDTGRTWVVTPDALFLRIGTAFRPVRLPGAALGSVRQIAIGGGRLIVSGGQRLLRATIGPAGIGALEPLQAQEAGTTAPDLGDARFVASDGQAGFLLGCGEAICRLDRNGDLRRFGTADGLPADRWEAAIVGRDGSIWARSLRRLAWRAPGAELFSSVAVPGGDNRFFALVPDRLELVSDTRGGVITQSGSGLLRWDGSAWHIVVHHGGGLAAAPIQAMMFDREGSLWVGSLGHGAFRSIGLGSWQSWNADDGLSSDLIWSMARRSDGALWVASFVDAAPLGSHAVSVPGGSENVAATRGDRLWFTPLAAPLECLDPVGGLEHFGSVGNIFSLQVDDRNRLLICSSEGLLVAPDADAPAATFKLDRMLSVPSNAATLDASGLIWVAAAGGLYRERSPGHFERVVALDRQETVSAIQFVRPDELWLGTVDNGVLRFRTAGRIEPLDPLEPPILSSRYIAFLHRDRHDRVWIGTDSGIDLRGATGLWRHLGASDGLISNDIDQGAVFEDRDGSIWFGTSHGLSHLIDPDRPVSVPVLHPHLTGVLLGTQLLGSEPARVVFQAGATSLTIRFADLDYAVGRPITYRYRMSGLETGWNDTTGHEVRYAGLPAGRFEFEMVAVDASHRARSAPVRMELRVRAPWWRRWWFYAAVTIGASTVLVLAWQLRVRLLLRQQQRLESMVVTRTAEIEQAREELHRLALCDALTGLPNRRALMSILEAAVARAASGDAPIAVLLCDIDHFKRINDAFGHVAGDNVLGAFGARLRDALMGSEAAGRYGGEEFCVLLQGSHEHVEARVEMIRAATSANAYLLGPETEGFVTSSGGIAFFQSGDTALSMLARADAALYEAKENGRNRVERQRAAGAGAAVHGKAARVSSRAEGFDGLLDPAEIALRDDLETALREGQFLLHFQPVVDIARDEAVSCEALIRWHSPTRGRVSPVDFIPFAERIGLMPAIGDWILQAACREAASWPERLVISVNLSPEQLRLPDLLARLDAALAETGLSPHRLELEITETAMIEDAVAARVTLEAIRERGIKIALDDFGTGYSSLSFLRTLPFDRVKIDRSFVQDLDFKPEAYVIVRAIVDMSRNLNASVTAEGVETDEQISLLRAAGCVELQGYRIGRPCAAADLRRWIAAFDASHETVVAGRG